MDVSEIRRYNLRHLIRAHFGGNINRAAKGLGMGAQHISRLALFRLPDACLGPVAPNHHMGSQVARKIEQAVGLPRGWMDLLHEKMKGQLPNAALMLLPDLPPHLVKWLGALDESEATAAEAGPVQETFRLDAEERLLLHLWRSLPDTGRRMLLVTALGAATLVSGEGGEEENLGREMPGCGERAPG